MRSVKLWVFVAFVAGALAGLAVPSLTAPSKVSAEERKVELKSHWRNHDGHWSYFDERDKCWYYTDGKHWYTHEGEGWKVYKFDKKFGHDGFEHGEYKVPGVDIKIELPKHKIYIP